MRKTLKEITQPLETRLGLVDKSIAQQLTTGIPILDNSALHLFSRGGKRDKGVSCIALLGDCVERTPRV